MSKIYCIKYKLFVFIFFRTACLFYLLFLYVFFFIFMPFTVVMFLMLIFIFRVHEIITRFVYTIHLNPPIKQSKLSQLAQQWKKANYSVQKSCCDFFLNSSELSRGKKQFSLSLHTPKSTGPLHERRTKKEESKKNVRFTTGHK